MAHRCCSVSAAHMSSLTHSPPSLAPSGGYIICLLRPPAAALRRQLGPAELLLPSSSKQSKVLASFHFINTHNPHSNQSLLHHFFFCPRDSSLRLHSLHFALIPTTPTLAYPNRTNSAHSNASSARSVSHSPTSRPRPDSQTAPNMADAADEDLFADL